MNRDGVTIEEAKSSVDEVVRMMRHSTKGGTQHVRNLFWY